MRKETPTPPPTTPPAPTAPTPTPTTPPTPPLPPTPGGVFTEKNFAPAFSRDLQDAIAFCYIESAFVTVDGIKRFSQALQELVLRGVRTCTFIQKPREYDLRDEVGFDPARRAELKKTELAVELLEAMGVHVNLKPGLHLKLAVIDQRITWGGSLNLLSYTKFTEEEIWRWTDPLWAHDTVKRRKYADCTGCLARLNAQPANCENTILLENHLSIGREIARARKFANITQEQLAVLVGVNRDTIVDLESGRRVPKIESLIRVMNVFDKRLMIVPSHMTKAVAHWIEISR